jgi:hypothetical protein
MQDFLLYENSILHKDVKQQSLELEHIREFIQSIQNSHRQSLKNPQGPSGAGCLKQGAGFALVRPSC